MTCDPSWLNLRDKQCRTYGYSCELKMLSIYQILKRIREPKQVNESVRSSLVTAWDSVVWMCCNLSKPDWSLGLVHFQTIFESVVVYVYNPEWKGLHI